MNTSKIVSIVITTIAVALSVSSISFTGHVFAQKDDNSNSGGGSSGGSSGGSDSSSSSGSSSGGSSSGSSKSDYDKFQSCLSDDATGGSATKQQIKDCFSSTYGGGSSSGGSGSSSGGSGSSSG